MKKNDSVLESTEMPKWYRVRVALIVLELALVYCLSDTFQPFFYQAF